MSEDVFDIILYLGELLYERLAGTWISWLVSVIGWRL
jgi:hypothetical protein